MQNTTRSATKVLIVDDHPVVLSGCRSLFASDSSVKIDEATDAYFDDARKRLYFTRLRDGALSLHAAGSLEKAIDALLVAYA